MIVQLACIVEGHGEVPAVRILVRRIAQALDPNLSVQIPPPLRVSRSRIVKVGEIERSVDLAARKTGGLGAVLVLIDSDDDCPARLGPELLARAQFARGDVPIGVVLAKREFEAWFLASALSLRGVRGLPDDLSPPSNPEAIRGAKEWLSGRMAGNLKYQEILDQPALTEKFDFAAARHSDSFDKCYREVTALLTTLCQRQAPQP